MTTADSTDRILEKLNQLRARCPELRFGQLIATIGMLAEGQTGQSFWDVEDAEFVVALNHFSGDTVRRFVERTPGGEGDRGEMEFNCALSTKEIF